MNDNFTGAARSAGSLLVALQHRVWELPRARRNAEKKRREEQKRSEQSLRHRLLEAQLPALLLAMIRAGDQHGYGIVRKLGKAGLPLVREARVYPGLRRLERDGLVEGYIDEEAEGPPRKCYRILPAGMAASEAMWAEWRKTVWAIDALGPRGDRG